MAKSFRLDAAGSSEDAPVLNVATTVICLSW
jgi:hypothetical protein